MLDACGRGGLDESLDTVRFGVEEHLLGAVQRGRQSIGTLKIGRYDLHARRDSGGIRVPARRPDRLARREQTTGDMTTHVSSGPEDNHDHGRHLLLILGCAEQLE
jgi:hypothetical protein